MMNTTDDIICLINIGNPDEFTIKQLAEIIIELTTLNLKLFIYHPLKMTQCNDNPQLIAKEILHGNRQHNLKMDYKQFLF